MYFTRWFVGMVVLLVAEVRTRALQDNLSDMKPNRCYTCHVSNASACVQAGGWRHSTAVCPGHRPLCATVATAPDFASSLTCAPVSETPCSLNIINNSLKLMCSCGGNFCNAPFSYEVQIKLVNLSTESRHNLTDITQIFFGSSKFWNVSNENLYKAMTIQTTVPTEMPVRNSSQFTTLMSVTPTISEVSVMKNSEKPKAEALKQDATVPSDDDEDEGEGSGAYEETRSHGYSVLAPAAPNSFLPANNNSAPFISTDLILPTFLIYILV